METPSGIDLKVGQIWHELDSRWLDHPRQVKILGWEMRNGELKVNIEGFVKSWAKLSREKQLESAASAKPA